MGKATAVVLQLLLAELLLLPWLAMLLRELQNAV
jgi:hypothetical protein